LKLMIDLSEYRVKEGKAGNKREFIELRMESY
jgi:hypothetical protein